MDANLHALGRHRFLARHNSLSHILRLLSPVTLERLDQFFNAGAFGLLAVSCCMEQISGCQSGFTWRSTGARRTFMVSPTAANAGSSSEFEFVWPGFASGGTVGPEVVSSAPC